MANLIIFTRTYNHVENCQQEYECNSFPQDLSNDIIYSTDNYY